MSAASRPNGAPVMGAGPPERPADESAFDRRTFLESVGATGAAWLAACLAPLAVARAADRRVSPHPGSTLPATEPSGEDPSPAWHVDDMWGHRPRYAHPIPHGPARASPVLWEHVDPIDHMLML
jgi:hypothetical protein